MNVELLTKIAALLGSIFGLYKLFAEIHRARKPALREEFAFAKAYLAELTDQTHPYLVEKGYLAISGDQKLTAAEIRYLLSLPQPSRALRNYSGAKELLKFNASAENEGKVITFRGRFSSTRFRTWSKRAYLALYTIFAGLTVSPLVFANKLFAQNWPLAIFAVLLSAFSFGPVAWSALRSYGRLKQAEYIAASQ